MKLWTVAIWLPLETTAYDNAAPCNLSHQQASDKAAPEVKTMLTTEAKDVYAICAY